jgi:hypothetical protein
VKIPNFKQELLKPGKRVPWILNFLFSKVPQKCVRTVENRNEVLNFPSHTSLDIHSNEA